MTPGMDKPLFCPMFRLFPLSQKPQLYIAERDNVLRDPNTGTPSEDNIVRPDNN